MSSRNVVMSAGGALVSTDPYFQNNVLLLPADGTNGAQNNTFLDKSQNNFTITRNGNTTQGTFSPYGNLWSNYFSSTNALYNTSAPLIGSTVSTFTAEAWVFLTATPTNASYPSMGTVVTLNGQKTATPVYLSFGITTSNTLSLYWYDGTGKACTSSGTIPLNQWTHIAVSVNANAITLYINGVSQTLSGTTTLTNRAGSVNEFTVGGNYYSTTPGYISNVRVTNTALYTSNFTPSTTPLTAVSGTSLLTCQSNRFIDNSSNNFTITRNGDVKVTPFSPFLPFSSYYANVNGASAYFDGIGDSLTCPANSAFAFESGDFTIEAWVYQTQRNTLSDICSCYNYGVSGDWSWSINSSGNLCFQMSTSGAQISSSTIPLNTWTHVIVTRTSAIVRQYINGLQVSSGSYANYVGSTTPFSIGASYNLNAASTFYGYICDLRIVKGTALYVSLPAFTPSTTPLTAITNTSFLAVQDVLTKDYSTSNYSLTVNGSVTLGTSGPFGSDIKGKGAVFTANTGQAIYTTGGNLAITTGPFTIEGWIKPTTYVGWIVHNAGWRAGNNIGWGVTIDSSGYLTLAASAGVNLSFPAIIRSTESVPLNTWSHFAFVRNADNIVTCLINGVPSGSAVYSASLNLSAGWSYTYYSAIGGWYADNTWQSGSTFAGQISNIRISKTAAFYPVSPPLVPIPSSPISAVSKTSLLCDFRNAGVYDATAKNNLETIGNVQINTTIKKYGAGSMYFDGTGDYLYSPATENLVFGTGDFTIETWIYFNSVAADMILFDMRAASGNGAYPCIYTTASTLRYYVSSADRITSSTLTTGRWYHIAVSRSSSITRMFVDGIAVGSWADTTNYLCSRLYIGTSAFSVNTANFNGYMDDFRITKGIARYTNNFTPADWGTDTALLSDQYYKYVSLLLRGNGTNAAQNNTFVDSSSNNFTITRAGNTTQGTFSPFSSEEGKWSNYFNADGDYITTPYNSAFDLTGDFSIETMFYAIDAGRSADANKYGTLIGVGTAGSTSNYYNLIILISGGVITSLLFDTTNNTTVLNPTGLSISLNTWHHIIVCRSGSTISMFVDGVRVATATNSTSFTVGGTLTIGRSFYGNTYQNWFKGYISNARIVKGSSPYNPALASITVPTSPLTAVSGTSLLTCQSNRFKDNSSNNFAITVTGNAKVLPSSPFAPSAAYDALVNGGSAYFDGTGDYLTTPATNQFAPTGDFTIGFWWYPSALTNSYHQPIGNYTGNNSTDWLWEIPSNGSVLVYLNGSTIRISGAAGTIKVGQWYYLALVRSGTTVTAYVNGTSLGTYTLSGTFGSASKTIYIGNVQVSAAYGVIGYLSGLTLVDGSAITAVPVSPPTPSANTKLLCNFTNAGIIDTSCRSNAETIGNAQISTSVKKYGTGSMYFDGTSDGVYSTSPLFNFGTSDFTIEGWFYFNNGTSNVMGAMWVNYVTWGAQSIFWGKHTTNSGNVAVYIYNVNTNA